MQGLTRNNNLSDLADPIKARANLGLADLDYRRIKGLWSIANLNNLCFQRIARSSSNFQVQLNTIGTALAGVSPSAYASRSGDTLTGTWTNVGLISAGSIMIGGSLATPSSDPLFLPSAGSTRIASTKSLSLNYGLNTSALISEGNVVQSKLKVVAATVPILVSGVTYKVETT